MEKIDILLRFLPNETKEDKELSSEYVNLALKMNKMDMDSREKTIAMERLEESYMWAKKGLILIFKEDHEEDFYGDDI